MQIGSLLLRHLGAGEWACSAASGARVKESAHNNHRFCPLSIGTWKCQTGDRKRQKATNGRLLSHDAAGECVIMWASLANKSEFCTSKRLVDLALAWFMQQNWIRCRSSRAQRERESELQLHWYSAQTTNWQVNWIEQDARLTSPLAANETPTKLKLFMCWANVMSFIRRFCSSLWGGRFQIAITSSPSHSKY